MRAFLKRIVVLILTTEARLALMRHKPYVIAVTGSVGKTTTKDAIFAALSGSLHVRKSEKSLNSDIGVPLAILGLENAWGNPLKWLSNLIRGATAIWQPYPAWLVLEVGADHPGDIKNIARWLRPRIAVITRIPDVPVHVEYFPSPEAVLAEKWSLAEAVPADGAVILNGDDARLVAQMPKLHTRVVTYGFEKGSAVRGTHESVLLEHTVPAGMRCRVQVGTTTVPLLVHGALGRPRVYAALAALAVAEMVGADLSLAAQGLGMWQPPPGRMRLIAGIAGSTIIDDTYNSSPTAADAALVSLGALTRTGRKVAILGDMLELGRYSVGAHRDIGARAAENVDILITIGLRARGIADGARDAGLPEERIHSFDQGAAAQAAGLVRAGLSSGDVVLVKGSQGMRLERVVKELMAEPERAKELLVRQEDEWLVR